MNILYEESGNLKVGSVVSCSENSRQVDSQHGKRIKVKTTNILLEFSSSLDNFLTDAEKIANEIDLDFLWEVCPEDEFEYQKLSSEYFGETPSAVENAAILILMFGAPMYFYKKGKLRFKAAPKEALQAALAGILRKKQEQEQIDTWVEEMIEQHLPDEIATSLLSILHSPNKNSLTYKAFDLACQKKATTPLRLAFELGGIRSGAEYLLTGFLFEYFPQGRDFPKLSSVNLPTDLPIADISAFSIDDRSTTEIDDALSLSQLADGKYKVGIHIAAPTLGIAPESDIEQLIFQRLSTVYFPSDKITMLPDELIQQFTLQAGSVRPVFSLYATVDENWNISSIENRIEQIKISANIRHHELEPVFNEQTLSTANHGSDFPFKTELVWLWQFTEELEKLRGKYDPNRPVQYDYSVDVDANEKVTISSRARGTPMDKLVAELMIFANSEWAKMLSDAGLPGIFRSQNMGKVRMSTHPEPHAGLGVAQYAWCTSPLRRAADYINQRQLTSILRKESAQFKQGDARLFAILRDFDTTYNAYNTFQNKMEHFWCLRWFRQENIHEVSATYLKDDLVRLNNLPLRLRVAGLPSLNRGDLIQLAIDSIDELTQNISLRFITKSGQQEQAKEDNGE